MEDRATLQTSAEARLAELIVENAVAYAIFTLAADGTITSWSRGAEMIFGYAGREAVGMHFRELFSDPDRSAQADVTELETALRVGRAEDSRWHVRKSGERFWANGMTMPISPAGAAGFLKITRDETSAKLAEEQRVLLLNELNHRIKNTLATVQSIAEQTLRGAGVDRFVRQDLSRRLIALSEAHNVLVDQNWAGADLAKIITTTLAPHERDGGGRFVKDGPPVRLSPQQAVSMALILHELATNAVKYGALSNAEGQVRVAWNTAQDGLGARYLTLLWEERGGPPVAPPARNGFGSRLIARTFGEESGGKARLEYPPQGARCVIELPLSSREEAPLRL